jgi:diguanylate cyclase (GGDEF)-like protein/PAS domain S-box-containing protein
MFRGVSDEAIMPASGTRNGQIGDAELLRAVLDTAHEAFVLMDADGLVRGFNREAERTFGLPLQDVLGRELAELIVPVRYREAHREGIRRYLKTGAGELIDHRTELSALHRDGHEFPIEMTISAIRSDDVTGGVTFHAFLHDISERKRTERVLLAMQSVTRAMARAESPAQAMTALLSTLGEAMGWEVGIYWQQAHDGSLERLASWSADAPGARQFDQACRELHLSVADSFPGRAMRAEEPLWLQDSTADDGFVRSPQARSAGLHAAIAVPVRRNDATVGAIEFLAADHRVRDLSVSSALAAVGAQVGELLGVLEERQALLTSLARLALTDQLTGLPNRRAWEEGLQRELARADREGNPVCVAVIDLDKFKQFNDTHGHQAGDALLAEAARAWQTQLRASDLLARYGGEEFAAVIPAWPLSTAVEVVERLRAATPGGLTASAGIAAWDGIETGLELFGRADAALYEAKQSGRDRTIAVPAAEPA